jgi:hypothetical protein
MSTKLYTIRETLEYLATQGVVVELSALRAGIYRRRISSSKRYGGIVLDPEDALNYFTEPHQVGRPHASDTMRKNGINYLSMTGAWRKLGSNVDGYLSYNRIKYAVKRRYLNSLSPDETTGHMRLIHPYDLEVWAASYTAYQGETK